MPKACDRRALCQAPGKNSAREWRALADTKEFNYLQEHGRATREQIAKEFKLEQKELEKHFLFCGTVNS